MDEPLDRSLRDQEQSLRAAIAVFSRASHRVNSLGGDIGWVGPARAAYDAALRALWMEVRAAELHLNGALRDTVSAITLRDAGG